MSQQAIDYLVHHVFLPPKVPQEDDFPNNHHFFLLDTLANAFEKFQPLATHHARDVLNMLDTTIRRLKMLHGGSNEISESKLKDFLLALPKEGMFCCQSLR